MAEGGIAEGSFGAARYCYAMRYTLFGVRYIRYRKRDMFALQTLRMKESGVWSSGSRYSETYYLSF